MEKLKQIGLKIKGNKKPFIMFLVLILAFGVGSYLLAKGGKDAVSAATIHKNSLLTAEVVNTSFQQVGGKVTSIEVEEGESVKAGTVLMKLDTTDMDFQLSQLQVNLDKINLQIEQANEQITSAKEKASIGEQKALVGIETAETEKTSVEKGAQAEDIEKQKLAVASAKESVETAKKSLEIAEETVKATEETVALAQKNFERMQSLYDNGIASKVQLEEAQNKLVNANTQLKTANAQVETAKNQVTIAENTELQQQASLEKLVNGATEEQRKQAALATEKAELALQEAQQAQKDIETQMYNIELLEKEKESLQIQIEKLETDIARMTLRAPVDGKLTNILPNIGENVSPNSTVVLIETDQLYYDVYINEDQLAQLTVGAMVEARVVPLNQSVQGTVKLVNTAPKYASLRMSAENGMDDISSFIVRIYVDRTSELLPGMTVEVDMNEAVH
nr:HlyD family efflux transporter periplasmic adaptor subunit [Lysinibacillus timonensis]